MENNTQKLDRLGSLPEELFREVISYLSFDEILEIRLLSEGYRKQEDLVIQRVLRSIKNVINQSVDPLKKIIEKAKQDKNFAIAALYYKPSADILLSKITNIEEIGNAHSEIIKKKFFNRALYIYLEEAKFRNARCLFKDFGAQCDPAQINRLLKRCLEELEFNDAGWLFKDFGAQCDPEQLKNLLSIPSSHEHFQTIEAWRSKLQKWYDQSKQENSHERYPNLRL